MEKLISLFGAIILSITTFIGLTPKTTQTTPVNDEVTPKIEVVTVTPTIPITITPLSTPIVKQNPLPTPTPTISQELMDQCKNVSKPEKYFSGFGCYYDEYKEEQKNIENEKTTNNSIETKINNLQTRMLMETMTYRLLPKAKSGLGDLFYAVCLKVSPKIFTSCSNSLERNKGRLATQIYTNDAAELKKCVSKDTSGDTKMKMTIEDYFWKWKMRNNMERLYLHCANTDGTLDQFNF